MPTNDLYIQFTEEELDKLDIKNGDKFDIKLQEDGSVKLEKYAKLELDINEWPVELLHFFIKESCEKDISVNEVISNLLRESLDNLDLKEKLK
jgi:hypothetical protein